MVGKDVEGEYGMEAARILLLQGALAAYGRMISI
jgi:hypothetical protein